MAKGLFTVLNYVKNDVYRFIPMSNLNSFFFPFEQLIGIRQSVQSRKNQENIIFPTYFSIKNRMSTFAYKSMVIPISDFEPQRESLISYFLC